MDTAFQCYQAYLALKAHFDRDDYCYFKFNGKTRAKITAFEARRDKYQFARLAKNPNYKDIILANLVVNSQTWVGELLEDKAEQIYLDWCKKMNSLTYLYTEDLNKLQDGLNSNIKVESGHPHLLTLYQHHEVSLETLIILDALVSYRNHWDKRITEQYVWPDIRKKMVKYRPFLKFDVEKLREITLKRFLLI